MNPNYSEFKFPQIKAHPWNKVFKKNTPPSAIDLISKVLVYNPEKRLKPMEALLHPFFDELREKETKLPNGSPLPDLFAFTKGKLIYFLYHRGKECSNTRNNGVVSAHMVQGQDRILNSLPL